MTEDDAARWMLAEYERDGFLYQEAAASHLFHLQDEALAPHSPSKSLISLS